MQAETGFEIEESAPPLRVSGFLSLLLGSLSCLSLLGQPLLVLPLLAILSGLFALRRSSGQTPVGTRPAMVGLVLAFGFGSCGLFLPMMKTWTLSKQAEQFSRYYLEVIARGNDEFAMELRKDYVNRLPLTMSLTEHYMADEAAARLLQEFREEGINETIRERGPGAEWILDRPIRIYYSYQREHAEVVWADPTGETSTLIQMFLQYRVDSKGDGQWHVDVIQTYRERIVAEQVL
jgi:hypothetical protein